METSQPSARQEWRANWTIVVAAMVGLSFASVPHATIGFFIDPLREQFGWNAKMLTSGLTIFAVVTFFLTPVSGAIVDRYGARWVGVAGSGLVGIAFAAFALMTGALWQWLLAWTVYSFVALGIRTTVWNSAVSSMFDASRGLAMALVFSGLALASIFAPPLARWLIDEQGWRMAYAAIGLGWGGLGFVLVLLFFHDRRSRKRAAAPQSGEAAAPVALPGGMTFAQAYRDQRIIRITIATFLLATAGAAVTVFFVPMVTKAGITRAEAAGVASLMGITAFVGKLGAGWLLDRFTSPLIPFAAFASPALGYLLLWYGPGSLWMVSAAMLINGLGGGASLPVTGYLATRYGGVRHFGKIFGVMSSMLGLAGGLGPLLAAFVYDSTGSYSMLMLVTAVMALAAGLLVLALGPYPHFSEESPEPASAEPLPSVA